MKKLLEQDIVSIWRQAEHDANERRWAEEQRQIDQKRRQQQMEPAVPTVEKPAPEPTMEPAVPTVEKPAPEPTIKRVSDLTNPRWKTLARSGITEPAVPTAEPIAQEPAVPTPEPVARPKPRTVGATNGNNPNRRLYESQRFNIILETITNILSKEKQ